jgi:hypothetical protein
MDPTKLRRRASVTRRGLMRFRLTASLILSFAFTVAWTIDAHAVQHPNANIYVNWRFTPISNPSLGQNLDQEVLPIRKAPYTYWAQLWKWTDDPTHGGYIGLQTNGNRSDGSVGDTANFSLWDSIDAKGPRQKSCARNAEANGYNCASSYSIKANSWYRLRVWKGASDSRGQWWSAYVLNETSGTESWIGSIEVGSSHQFMTTIQNFSEYFGPQVACNQVPMSIIDFTQPAGDLMGNGAYRYYSTYTNYTRANCTGGTVSVVSEHGTRAARVTLGDKL